MAWIESHQTLSRHRKTLRAAALLKVDRHKLIGHLHELWWWGLDNADIDGRLEGAEMTDVADGAGWKGKNGDAFVRALVEVGFIDQEDGVFVLHNWYAYAGKLNTRRDGNRERQRRHRDRKRQDDDPSRVTVTTGHALGNGDVTGLPYPTQPYPTQPNQTEDGGLASSSSDDDDPAEFPIARMVREFRDTGLSRLPPKFARDPEQSDAFEELARDYVEAFEGEAAGMLAEALSEVRRQEPTKLPFPSTLRRYMPQLPAKNDIAALSWG